MPENFLHKLGLGTVQFGLDYGVSNSSGKTPESEVARIIEFAQKIGLKTIDTAHLYGNSEEVLGHVLEPENGFEIVTKTIPVKKPIISTEDVDLVRNGFESSLSRLNQNFVYGILLHHPEDLKSQNGATLHKFLCDLRAQGKVKKIGASVYDEEQINFVLDNFDIDMVQLPMNVFDQRLLKNGVLKKLKTRNIEIHVRSAFLQGVIFMSPEDLPEPLQGISETLKNFKEWSSIRKIEPMAAALSFLMSNKDIDRVICGVNSFQQLEGLVSVVSNLPVYDQEVFNSFAINDTSLIDPSKW